MIIDLIFLGIFLALTIGIWLIYLSVAGTTGLITLFSTRIPIINGIFISALFIIGGLMGYLDETPWGNPLSPIVTVLIGIGLYVICHFVQKTTVGFWLFAIIMSPFWAAVGSAILLLLTHQNWIVFWIAFAVLTVLNIYLHIRSRRFKLKFSDPSISSS